MTGTFATTAIITKGLTCGLDNIPACQNGLITTHFSLYCIAPPEPPEPPVKPITGGGGGYYPGHAWNKIDPGQLSNFYKPVPNVPYYIVPPDREHEFFKRHKHVVIKVQFGQTIVEKEYSVSVDRANTIVKVTNIVNNTMDKIKITGSNLRQLATTAVVKIKNLKRIKIK